MKEERSVLQDVVGTAKPTEESKTRKYIRIILTCIGLSLFVLIIVSAALRKWGG
jgi:hypothetical protein